MKIIFGDVMITNDGLVGEDAIIAFDDPAEGCTELNREQTVSLCKLLTLQAFSGGTIEEYPIAIARIYDGTLVTIAKDGFTAATESGIQDVAKYRIPRINVQLKAAIEAVSGVKRA